MAVTSKFWLFCVYNGVLCHR